MLGHVGQTENNDDNEYKSSDKEDDADGIPDQVSREDESDSEDEGGILFTNVVSIHSSLMNL